MRARGLRPGGITGYGSPESNSMLEIYVDADACPVKEEVNRVAARYQLNVTYVANSRMRLPDSQTAKLVVVAGLHDAADHWIVEHVTENDIVVTGDIPLAHRCVQKGAKALGSSGHAFTEDNIGHLLATRDLMKELREAGTLSGGGPEPFQKKDRSRFLHTLDQIIQNIKQENK